MQNPNGKVPNAADPDEAPNPFDPRRLRISQRFCDGLDVRPVLATVAVCKPRRQWFVRTHPDPGMKLETFLLHRERDQQYFLVDPAVAPALPGEAVPTVLFSAVNMNGGVFLWPVRLPDETGRRHQCHLTALQAAELAQTEWVRLSWDLARSDYAVVQARGQVPVPAWPDTGLQKPLSIGFQGRFIDTIDHPIVRELRGDFS